MGLWALELPPEILLQKKTNINISLRTKFKGSGSFLEHEFP